MTAMLVLVMFLAVSGCDQISMANRSEGRVEAFQEDAPAIRIVVDNRDAPRGAGANRDPYLEYVEQNTRLKLKLITPNSGSYADFLNALMSSDDIPDLIHTDDPAWIAKYAEMGLLLPLDELLHNSVSGRKLLQLFPEEAWKASTFDGRIYAIPSLREVYGDEVMMARKDWLDALDLDPPETLEQYKRVMYAFTYGDPDRNLKNDTWGLTIMPGSLARTAPFFGALRELREPSLYAEDMLESFLNQLIILTYRNFFTSWDSPSDMGKPGGGAEEAVYRAMQYIDRHLSDMKDLSELSRAVGYSYSYLSYLFAKTTGMNLRDYFTHKRKQKVLELMRSGRHSLTEIAEMMNYRSIHTFSRAFKKAFGVSPSEYKKRHMQTAEN